jgi:hypothetical protein
MKNEILIMSYWEHFKKLKDIYLIYPPEHPKRIELQNVVNELSERIKLKS